MVLSCPILLRKEPEGGYTVVVPSLPSCVTYGETIKEAVRMARKAIELYIESLRDHHEEIPTEEETLEYTVMVEVHAKTLLKILEQTGIEREEARDFS